MSGYRDRLSPEAREKYDAATAQAGALLARASADVSLLAAAQGPRAVAEAAWFPGHRLGSAAAIEARVTELTEAARTERAA